MSSEPDSIQELLGFPKRLFSFLEFYVQCIAVINEFGGRNPDSDFS